MSTLAVIQARMGSTRFPGKVLQPIGGKAILLHIVERLEVVPSIDEIVVAIPDCAVDQPLRTFCREQRISFWSGSEADVLDRYYGTARRYGSGDRQHNLHRISRISVFANAAERRHPCAE